jgi:beta-lactamase class D
MPFETRPFATRFAAVAALLAVFLVGTARPQPSVPTAGSCFLLLDTKDGNLKRDPAELCATRLPPASTFKIPHALAALESGIIKSADDAIAYDGTPHEYEAWRRDHTLATAMRYSVLWYFQEIARRLGMEHEEFYLRRLRYGNADPSSGLTTFWLGGSLRISPEEQLTFLRRLYYDELPLRERTMQMVREILVQPADVIVNATGQHSFDAPWPAGTVVSAKTGSTSFGADRAVRWIVGRVERDRHAWIFVSCVTGATALDAMAAVDLAAAKLRANNVL